MKLPRKFKKQMKKDIKNNIEITQEIFTCESFFLHVYNKPLNRLLNSLVYLNYPTRAELIAWWVKHCPNDEATELAKNKKDLFKDLPQIRLNISKGYMKSGKTLALTTILK